MARQGFFSRLFRRRPKAVREHDASASRRAGRRSKQRGQPATPLPLSEPAAPTAVDGSEAVGSESSEPWYRQSGPLFDTSFSDSPTPARPPGGGAATGEFAPPRAADPAATATARSVPMIQRVGQVTDPGPLPERMRSAFDPPSKDGEAPAADEDTLTPAAEASEAVSAAASAGTPAETEADGVPRQHGNSSPWAPPTAAERSEPGIGLDETVDGIGHGPDSPEPLIDFSDPQGAAASSGDVPTGDMAADETSDGATGEDIPATDDDAMPEPERLGAEDATGASGPGESDSTTTPEDLADGEGVLPASLPPSEIAQHEPPMVVPVRGYYIARTEDTLRSVAAQFLNAPERWSELRTLNAAYPGIVGLDPDELLPEGAALALPGDPLPWGRPDPVYLWTLAETFLYTAWGREPTPEEVVPFWRGLTQGALPEAASPPLGNELPGIAEIAARGGDSGEKPSQDAAPMSPPSAFEMPAVVETPAEAPDGETPPGKEQGETADLDASDDSEPGDIADDESAAEAAPAEGAEDAMPAASVAAPPDDAMPTPTLSDDDEGGQATPAASEPDEATESTSDHTEPAPDQTAAALQTEQRQPAGAAAFEVESSEAPQRDDAQPETFDSEAAADVSAGAVEAPPADIGTIEPADSDDAVEEAFIAGARIVEDTAPETVEDTAEGTAIEPEAEPAPDEPPEAEHGIEESAHAEPQIAEPPYREPQPAGPPGTEPVAAQAPPVEAPPPVYADPAAAPPQPPSAYVGDAPSPAPEAPTPYVGPEPPLALEPPPAFDEWPDEPTMPPSDPLAPYAGMPGMDAAEARRLPEAEAPRVPHFLPSVTGTTPSGLTAPVQSTPVGRSLAGTAVGDAMLLWQLARRRRQSQRATGAPDAYEQSLLLSAGSESLELIEAAMRHLRAVTVGQQRPKPDVLAVRSGTYGFEVLLDRPVPTPPGWRSASGGYVLELPQGVTARDLSAVGQGPSLCPALVPVGNTFEGPLLLNLEQVGCLAVSGPSTAASGLLSAIVSTLGSSPMAGHLRITAVGFESGVGMIGWESVAFTSYDSPELESLLANAYGPADGMIELLVIGPGNDLLIQRAGQISAAPESRLSLVGATSAVSARWPWRIHVDDTGTAVVHPISITMTAARAVPLEAPASFGGPMAGGVGPAGLR